MRQNNQERRCFFCGKRLLDEKLPVCKRCRLKAGDGLFGATSVLTLGGGLTLKMVVRKDWRR